MTHVESEEEEGETDVEARDGEGKVKRGSRGKKPKKEEVVLQDQTNLLPVRQVSPSRFTLKHRRGRCRWV